MQTLSLVGLSAAMFATVLTTTAAAGVMPALIAYEGSEGIGVVQPGDVESARLFYSPGTGSGTNNIAWSPNGETMAFGLNTPHGKGIGLVNRSGKLIAEVLLPHLIGPADIGWSPDGTQIAYLCLDPPILTTPSSSQYVPANEFFNVCALDMVTGAHRVLARSTLSEGISTTSYQSLSWSPSGDVIVVSGERDIAPGDCTGLGCGQPNIGVVDVSAHTLSALDGGDFYADPAFSYDGNEIAATNIQERGGVYILSSSGKNVREIVPPADGGSEPNWSPNGKELVFQEANGDLATVVVADGAPVPATDGDAADPSWVGPITLCTVPKLIGQTLAAAKRLVALAGCVVGTVTGPKVNRNMLHVVNQKPAANSNVATGTKVNIQIR